jgi:hypothetical protein
MKIPNLTILGYRISINGCNMLQIYWISNNINIK